MLQELKAFPLLECKSDDSGRFSGYAATYAKDSYGDRIAPGAFGPSIKAQRGKVPLFYDHQRGIPIGFSNDLAEDARGLFIEGQLAIDSTHGRDAHALLKTAKSVDYKPGLSIGFIPAEWEMDSEGSRVLKAIDLMEVSLTPFPVNRQARIEQFKSLRNVEQVLRDVGGCSRESAKRVAAMLVPYLSVDTDGKSLTPERDVMGQWRAANRAADIAAAFRSIR